MPAEQRPAPAYENATYDQLSFKGAHNSEQREEGLLAQIAWNPQAPSQGACRGVELDFTRHADASGGRSGAYFQVTHDEGGHGPPLAAYLGELLAWHRSIPDHDVLCVHLDIKDEHGDLAAFPDEIDTYLRAWFDPALLVRPADLAQGADLVGYVRQHGWPTLRQLASRFMIVLTGTEAWKAHYAQHNPPARLCFADVDVADDQVSRPPTIGDRAIANFHLHAGRHDVWRQVVRSYREARFLVRGFGIDDQELWNLARAAGVNMLATDAIRDRPWAQVGDAPFALSD